MPRMYLTHIEILAQSYMTRVEICEHLQGSSTSFEGCYKDSTRIPSVSISASVKEM